MIATDWIAFAGNMFWQQQDRHTGPPLALKQDDSRLDARKNITLDTKESHKAFNNRLHIRKSAALSFRLQSFEKEVLASNKSSKVIVKRRNWSW